MKKEGGPSFSVVSGGKEGQPKKSKEKKSEEIRKKIARQGSLNKEEKSDLVREIRHDLILRIKEGVLKSTGKLLSDEEAGWIRARMLGLAMDDEETKKEIEERFPDLTDYFSDIIDKLKQGRTD